MRFQPSDFVRPSWIKSHALGIVVFDVTLLLCAPSLLGGALFVLSMMAYGGVGTWADTASALVTLAVFVGAPLVSLAALIGALSAPSRRITRGFKYANLIVVVTATLSCVSLLLHFRK